MHIDIVETLLRRHNKILSRVEDYKRRIELCAHPDEKSNLQTIMENVEEDAAVAALNVGLARFLMRAP